MKRMVVNVCICSACKYTARWRFLCVLFECWWCVNTCGDYLFTHTYKQWLGHRISLSIIWILAVASDCCAANIYSQTPCNAELHRTTQNRNVTGPNTIEIFMRIPYRMICIQKPNKSVIFYNWNHRFKKYSEIRWYISKKNWILGRIF